MHTSIVTRLLFLFATVSVMSYSACDVFDFNTYYIQNKTDTIIQVRVFHKKPTNARDSVFLIPTESVVEIHRIGQSVGKGYKKNAHDIVIAFDSIWVYKGNLLSKRDFLNNNTWQFTSGQGNYNTVVTNDEFQ